MRCLLIATMALVLSGDKLVAADTLKVGDKAPQFSSMDDGGKTWKSEDHIGKKIVVIYFYPADFTGGCTKQACAFRDDYATIQKKNVEVIGVSGDNVQGHTLFKAYHKLPFSLLADEDGSVAKKFGVPAGKGGTSTAIDADGKKVAITQGVRIQRWTFVIDQAGKIVHIDKKVNAAADSKKIQEVVEKLSK